jgi:long-chain acyl-CoA synthetase
MTGTVQFTANDMPLQMLYHWAKTQPDKVYLSQPMGGGVMKDYTWAQTLDEVSRVAAHLKAQGWPTGTKIALMSKNCAQWIMSDLAIWMAGYVSVPLYPTLAGETVKQILTHSESKLCFIGKLDDWEMMRTGVPEGLPCISFELSPDSVRKAYPVWGDIIAKTAPIAGAPTRDMDELATIIYTSGTTGMPKGVMHSFKSVGWGTKSGKARLELPVGTRMLSYLPLAHVAERICVEHMSFLVGAHIFFAENLETFVKDIQRARPQLFFSVPRLWVKFQQGVQAKMPAEKMDFLLKIPILRGIIKKKILAGLGLDQVLVAAGGAAPMPPALLRWYDKLGLPIIEGYGMTENGAVSHATFVGTLRPGTVGKTYPGVEARIAPDTGEIQMRGPCVMLGYYKEPELTKATMTDDGWLRTGDKGALDAEGNLKITGRVKDLFKTSKGKYVAPAPIEDSLVMHPAIEACAVVGANLGQPLGLIMLSETGVKDAKGAKDALGTALALHMKTINEKLDPHEQMDRIIVVKSAWTVENGFVTPTFKIKRNKIEEAYGDHFETWSKAKTPVLWE